MTATNLIRSVVLLCALAAAAVPGTLAPARAGVFPGLAAIGERPSLIVPVQRGGGFRAPSYSPPVYRAPSPAPSYRAPTYNAPAYRAPAPTYRAPTYSAPPPQTYRPPPPQFRPPPNVQAPGTRPMVQRPGPPAWRIAPPMSSQAIQPGRLQPPSARAILPGRPIPSAGSRLATDPRGRIGGLSGGRPFPSNREFAVPVGTAQRAADRPRAISAPTPTRPTSFTPARIASPATVVPRSPDRTPRIATTAAAPSRPALRAPTIATRPAGALLPRERGAAVVRLASTRQLEAEQRRRLALASPPTIAELRRGFRGQFTAAGLALVTVRGRLLTVRPSLIGVRAPTRALAIAAAGRAASPGAALPGGQTSRGGGPGSPAPGSTAANDNTPPRAAEPRTASSTKPGSRGSRAADQVFVMAQGTRTPFVHLDKSGLVGATSSDVKRALIFGRAQNDVRILNRRLVRQQSEVRETGQDYARPTGGDKRSAGTSGSQSGAEAARQKPSSTSRLFSLFKNNVSSPMLINIDRRKIVKTIALGSPILVLTPQFNGYPLIYTAQGPAQQLIDPEFINARKKITEGAILYRLGTLGRSETAEGQFWALEHPSTPGYAFRHGIPEANIRNSDFIETARVKQGSAFVTRKAPPSDENPGGAIEVVVPLGEVEMLSFSYNKRTMFEAISIRRNNIIIE